MDFGNCKALPKDGTCLFVCHCLLDGSATEFCFSLVCHKIVALKRCIPEHSFEICLVNSWEPEPKIRSEEHPVLRHSVVA